MNRLCRSLYYLGKEEKGGILILVALMVVVLMGMAALVVDVGQMYTVRRQMVSAADSAALAAAMEKHNQQNKARDAAEKYAEDNDADMVLFDKNEDVVFTGSGDASIVSVRTSKEVNHYFAQILPGIDPSSVVRAIASAQVGPGNPLVPFVDVAWPFSCPCDPDCTCEVGQDDCTCGHDPDDPDSVCICTPDCPCADGCTCNYFTYSKEGDLDNGDYYMQAAVDSGMPAEYGDYFELHYDRWKDWEGATSGVFPYLRLGDMSGGSDLEEAIAGGYDGELEDVQPGTVASAEPGQTQGALKSALETRFQLAGDDPCSTMEDIEKLSDWYTCDLVVIIPLVTESNDGPKDFKIVGYASVLLDLVEYGGEKYVWAYFLEYLSYQDLLDMLGEDLDGFVLRLVKTPSGVFSEVAGP